MRQITPLVDSWTFAFGDEATGGGEGTGDLGVTGGDPWESVTIPHAWNTAPGGDPQNEDRRGPGVYRREIQVPALADRGGRVFLEVAAAGTVADVYIGDRHLATHRGGYSAFRCDLTDALDRPGDETRTETLTVRVDNSPTDDVYPLMGDHTIFGGLYRPVSLIEVDPVHIDLLDHGGPGVSIRQVSLDEDSATILVTVRVTNDGPSTSNETVRVRVLDHVGQEVATGSAPASVDCGRTEEVSVELNIASPRRWDGRNDPYLYRVVSDVGDDSVDLPLGLRTATVDAQTGFHLNGRPYRLHGVSRHHDINGTPAVSRAEIERDFDLIDEIGATAVRLAHYQHAEDVLDLCDERGVVVWAEVPVNSKVSIEDPLTNAVSHLTELIHQQRHHSSIVCWGVQNEAMIAADIADPRPVTAALVALAHREDPDRLSSQAQLTLVTPDDPINRLADLNALNLYHGWYHGQATEVGAALDRHRSANVDIPLGLSEYGADARTEYHSSEPQAGDYTEDYQAIYHEIYWQTIEAHPWIWSSFVWNMFDFASVIRNEGGTRGFNMKGLVTRDRQTRKDAFWWYKANWSKDPVLHICSKRFVNRPDDEIEVKVYSNLPEVRLLVDNGEVDLQQVDGCIARFRVPLGSGDTTVVALAGEERDEAIFRRVSSADPSYECPEPRRVGSSGDMASWYEDAGLELDHSLYGTWTNVGDLLADPVTKAVLIEEFGSALLDDPRLDMALGFPLDFVLSAAGAGITDEKMLALHHRLAAIPKPAS
ncbi:MAG TPA: glycoside hydrolase family 2 TIM barrel-domain containing protein [Microthrixaceae bacterium]|nr:glycoside hydrolase family 2 TIM barrel-domain containing protein [Microthrixaceae bacterium]